MGINFKDSDGKDKAPYLGSYGIGMSRLVGVLAEIFNDDAGLKWPKSVAPFLIHLVSLGGAKAEAEKLYESLIKKSVDVLWDDREESAGVKLSDADLIGMPYRIIISDKTLAKESVEIKERSSDKVEMVKLNDLDSWLSDK